MFTINAGDPLQIQLGEPISTNGEEVEISVKQEGANFIIFNKNSLTFVINQGITTNNEAGIYAQEITLTEKTDGLTETYTIRLTIVAIEQEQTIECDE